MLALTVLVTGAPGFFVGLAADPGAQRAAGRGRRPYQVDRRRPWRRAGTARPVAKRLRRAPLMLVASTVAIRSIKSIGFGAAQTERLTFSSCAHLGCLPTLIRHHDPAVCRQHSRCAVASNEEQECAPPGCRDGV